jgi:hypothetical protein
MIMIKAIKNFKVVGLAVLGLLIVTAGCTHRKVQTVGTHKVTVARHGFEKKFHGNEKDASFEYAGVSAAGEKMKVSINGDDIKVNGVDGRLRPGDSVLIGDEGVAVNQLDYGQTAKYLQDNLAPAEATVRQ